MALTTIHGAEGPVLHVPSGTIAPDTTFPRSGKYCIRCNPTTTGTGFAGICASISSTGDLVNSAVGTVFDTFYFAYATKPAANEEIFYRMTNTFAGRKADLVLTSGGVIKLYSATGTLVATGTTVLVANRYYRIDITTGTGASTTYTLKIDGVTEFTGSGAFGFVNHGTGYAGKFANTNGQTVDFFYDDCVRATGAFAPDPYRILPLIVRADGSLTTGWNLGTGSTYIEVDDEVTTSPFDDADTSYWMSNVNGDARTVRYGGLAAYGTIYAAQGRCRVRDNGGASSMRVRMRSGSTNLDKALHDPANAYIGRFVLSETDPATGAAWTYAAINAIEYGVVNGANVEVRCTSAVIEVMVDPRTLSLTRPTIIRQAVQRVAVR